MEPIGFPSGASSPVSLHSNPGTPKSANSQISKSSSVSVKQSIQQQQIQLAATNARLDTVMQLLMDMMSTKSDNSSIINDNKNITDIVNEVPNTLSDTVTPTAPVLVTKFAPVTGINIESDLQSSDDSTTSADLRKKIQSPSTARESEVDDDDITSGFNSSKYVDTNCGRLSMLREMNKTYAKLANVAPPTVVAVSASALNYRDVTLTALTIPAVLWLIKRLIMFQREHKHEKVHFNRAIPESLRSAIKGAVLIRDNPKMAQSLHHNWYDIENEDLIEMLRLAVSPMSFYEFERTFREGMSFKYSGVKNLSIYNLLEFYQRLEEYFLYIKDFIEFINLDRCRAVLTGFFLLWI